MSNKISRIETICGSDDELDSIICDVLRAILRIRDRFIAFFDKHHGAAIWYDEMRRTLIEGMERAAVLGKRDSPINFGGESLTPSDRYVLLNELNALDSFLRIFRNLLVEAGEWKRAWNQRAQMYAGAIRTVHSRVYAGPVSFILPAHPGQGSSCLTNCRCHWQIDPVRGDGNYDCYWITTARESCPECINRAVQWSPFKIRGWTHDGDFGKGTLLPS